jgi:hypothetical protein
MAQGFCCNHQVSSSFATRKGMMTIWVMIWGHRRTRQRCRQATDIRNDASLQGRGSSISTKKAPICEALQSHARQIRRVWHERNEAGKTVASRY